MKKKIVSILLAMLMILSTVTILSITVSAGGETKTIYCKNDQAWWNADDAAVGVHYTGGSAETSWPGVRMESLGDNLWKAEIPADSTTVVFTRVNPLGTIADWAAKTKDQTVPQDEKNLFTITTGSAVWGDPGCDGEWSVYTTGVTLTDSTVDFDEDFGKGNMTATIEDGVISIVIDNGEYRIVLELYTDSANEFIPAGTYVISDILEAGTALASTGITSGVPSESYVAALDGEEITGCWLLTEGTVTLSYNGDRLKVEVDAENTNGKSVMVVFEETSAPALTTWSALQDAINAAPGTDETPATETTAIRLTEDLTAPAEGGASITIPVGKDITLDLNGKVLNANGGAFSVITVSGSGKLTVIDSDPTAEHAGYVDANGLWHLGTGSGTAKTIKGGIITGGNATSGGGVSNFGTFTMTGGTIAGNTASTGGGIYTTANKAVTILTGGTVTGNTASTGGGLYYKEEECFAAGTPITMADGTRKAIETLGIGDLVRVFDHETGTVSSAKVYDFGKYPEKHGNVVVLHFTNQIDVTIVYGHSFFEKEQNQYVSVTKDNVATYVGHEFYHVDGARFETLIGYDFVDGKVDTYTITTEYHLNCVANGMLSNEDGLYTILTNVFEYGEDLKIDADRKASDIEKYGLFGFEKLKYASEETYDALNLRYMNVAFGKGMITPEDFAYIEAYWTGACPEIYCGAEEETEEKPVLRMKSLMASPAGTPVPAPTASGVYVGGSVKIVENVGGNLYLCAGKTITVGTGTVGDGNGVAAPTSGFSVGVTTQTAPVADTPVQFTANGAEDDAAFFASDSADYEVQYNTSGYLELKLHAHSYTGDYIEYDEDNHLWAKVCACGEYDTANALTGVDAPQATTGLAYTGNEQTGVAEATGYTVADGKKTAAGDYTAIATLSSGYIWSDGSTEPKQIEWSIAKAEQVVTISADLSKVYDMNFVYFNTYSKTQLDYSGDGTVTVEYKLAAEEDSAYTTAAPTNAGNYVVRVSVAEGTNYEAGFATKGFTISKATVSRVGFGDIAQPVATAVAPTSVSGIAIGAKYAGTVTWSPALTEGKFGYNTVYTVSVALEITPAYKDNYGFADTVILVKPTKDWVKSDDSTDTKLIYTKTFEKTGKAPQTVAITNDISKTYDGNAVSVPTYTKLGDGTVTVEYKLTAEEDTAYTTTAPTNTGSYIVRVSVAEGTNHVAGAATKEFTVVKAQNAIRDLTIGNWKDTESSKTPTATADFGSDNIVFTFYKGTSVLDAAPTIAGEYTVVAEVVGTDNYDGATAEVTFTVYESASSLFWLWILIAVIVVAGGFCVWFFFIKKKDEDGPDDPDNTPVAPDPKPAPTSEEKTAPATPAPEVSLKESLALAVGLSAKGVVKKDSIAKYLKETYGDGVEINCRANFTKPVKGKTEGLPLADTHYTLANGKRSCFVYVYETNGATLCLVKAPETYANALKQDHENVFHSAFPKAKTPWFSVAVDDTWTENDVYRMLDDVKSLNDGAAVESIPARKAEKPQISVVKEVSVADADRMMTDAQTADLTENSDRTADRTKKTMINIDTLSQYFADGETVTLEEIKKRVPQFDRKATFYKVCARGLLDKALTVDADDFSVEAKKMILLTGGKVLVSNAARK